MRNKPGDKNSAQPFKLKLGILSLHVFFANTSLNFKFVDWNKRMKVRCAKLELGAVTGVKHA